MSTRTALVLSGGGARAAYQAGVLQGISEILDSSKIPVPFPIITGVSAGSINASYLAAAKNGFYDQVHHLAKFWANLSSDQVIRTDQVTLAKLGLRWLRDLIFGGFLTSNKSTFILDSSPLIRFLGENISFNQIGKNLSKGDLTGVSFTATSYATGTSVTFFDGEKKIAPWAKSSRIGVRNPLGLEHVLASAAIPFFFKPVKIGGGYYGDGCIRSNTPLSPAIHLGAEKILAIGVRYPRSGLETQELNQQVQMDSIAVADIAGVMFNALFLDSLDFDVERLERINQTVSLLHAHAPGGQSGTTLKKIQTLLIRPSVDLGALAGEHFHQFPTFLRYLLRGIGASEKKGTDFLSYIAFDRAYTRKLITIGVGDAHSRKDEIEAFFRAD